jgi:transcriptional regulator with XRE-family HTH domain
MLRAARSLAGLSQQELAERASISRPCLTAWEGSSGSVPNAKARALHRVVSALEAEGIRFSDGGVHLQSDVSVRGRRSGKLRWGTTTPIEWIMRHGKRRRSSTSPISCKPDKLQ